MAINDREDGHWADTAGLDPDARRVAEDLHRWLEGTSYRSVDGRSIITALCFEIGAILGGNAVIYEQSRKEIDRQMAYVTKTVRACLEGVRTDATDYRNSRRP